MSFDACSINIVFWFGLAILILVNTITVEATAIHNSENIYYEIMKFIIKKEGPGGEDSKS